MNRKYYSLCAVLVCIMVPLHSSATSLQDQLNNIARVESEGKVREAAQKAAEDELARQQAEEIRKQQKLAQQAAERREAQKTAAQAAAHKAKEAERVTDKKRDQEYQDKLREIELTRLKLQLERESKRVNREEDFIDAELKREAAKTDVIQSGADSLRSVSSGTKSLMESEGKAREKDAGGIFD